MRGRIGLVTGPTLSYLTAGYAYGNVNTTVVTGGVPFAFSGGRSGWTWGSGVEAALGGNWTGKIEYLYVDLGDRTDFFAGGSRRCNPNCARNLPCRPELPHRRQQHLHAVVLPTGTASISAATSVSAPAATAARSLTSIR